MTGDCVGAQSGTNCLCPRERYLAPAMNAIFASILPIFALIVVGVALKRVHLMDDAGWRGLDRLGFYVLYPTLLFVSIVKADFSGIRVSVVMTAMIAAWLVVGFALQLTSGVLIRAGAIVRSQYSSIFQTTMRWNGFVALAVAQELFGQSSIAIVALVMASMVVPINLVAIYVVAQYADAETDLRRTTLAMVKNPIVLGCVFALLWRATGLTMPAPAMIALDLVGRGALAIGLITVGAGLKPETLLRPQWATALPVVLKLAIMPLVAVTIARGFGISGIPLSTIALCTAVPTAMNGYVVARQMGGDAPLYAAIVTLQTVISVITIPVMLAFAATLGA